MRFLQYGLNQTLVSGQWIGYFQHYLVVLVVQVPGRDKIIKILNHKIRSDTPKKVHFDTETKKLNQVLSDHNSENTNPKRQKNQSTSKFIIFLIFSLAYEHKITNPFV